MSSHFGRGHMPRSKMSGLELLSLVADMPLEAFVLNNSTIPYRRPITFFLPDIPHGSLEIRSLLRKPGMTRIQPGSYFCCECAAEDVQCHGTSYWHRNHQIPGRYWCASHGVPLSVSEQEDAFLYSPSNLLSVCEAFPLEVTTEWSRNADINRFLAIVEGLGSRTSPLDFKAVSKIMKARADKMDPNCGASDASGRRRLSVPICEAFPRPWLELIALSLPAKQRRHVSSQVYALVRMSSKSAWVYMLAASILFESAEEALQALSSVPMITPPRQNRLNNITETWPRKRLPRFTLNVNDTTRWLPIA